VTATARGLARAAGPSAARGRGPAVRGGSRIRPLAAARTREIASEDLLPLSERAHALLLLRPVLATIVAASVAAFPAILGGGPRTLAALTASYLAVAGLVAAVAIRWPARRVAIPAVQAGLLVDGIYLVAAIALTGGVESPLRFLLAAHLVAATLLGSSRTGLKLALWHTLLFLVAVRAIDDGILPVDAVRPAGGTASVALSVVALWAVAFATAAFAAASERALRRQRADLAALAAMAARIEERPTPPAIGTVLLEEACAAFGFRRGVVLGDPAGGLALVSATPDGAPAGGAPPVADPTATGVLREGTPRLVRTLDPVTDPALSALLPDARNVALLPLAPGTGPPVGVVALERGGPSRGIERSSLAMLERFVGHAALALRNAWLTEERDAQLERIRQLERELRSHNAELEERVAERTVELRETIAVLRETDALRRRLLDHVVRAAEEERRRIANDIHDDPVQKMVALKMRLELLAKAHTDDPDVARARQAVEGAIHSMRHLLFDLRPPVLDEAGFDEAVRYLLERAELPFAWSVEGAIEPDPPEQTRVILYRIAQEAVTNAKKHSEAAHLRVRLGAREGGAWMEIADDGVGFVPHEAVASAPGHLGLASMRERAEMAGGSCDLRSLPGGGTTLEVWLPPEAETVPRPPGPRAG
jgi:signal transduction histidine kinase